MISDSWIPVAPPESDSPVEILTVISFFPKLDSVLTKDYSICHQKILPNTNYKIETFA